MKQFFIKIFALVIVFSFLFLNINGVFINKAQALDPTGTITITKYNDANGNGSQDDGEILIVGWPVFISTEENYQNTEGKISPNSATNGSVFNNVSVGNYYICEVVQDGWENTEPGIEAFDWGDGTMVVCYERTLTENQSLAVSFGNHSIEEETTTTTTTTESSTTTTIEPSETTTTTVEEQTTTTTEATTETTTTTIVESASEDEELIEEESLITEAETTEEPQAQDWSWLVIGLLIIVGGFFLFSKK